MIKKLLLLTILVVLLLIGKAGFDNIEDLTTFKAGQPTASPVIPTNKPTIINTPTIKRLSKEELNKLYGPCIEVKVLMYHHVNDDESAKKSGYGGLNVNPEIFRAQMEYLKNHNYNVIWADDIANFFSNGRAIMPKSVVLTFDDAYEDNYLIAFPILKEYGYRATIFTPTGLVNNPNYVNWGQIKEMADSGLIRFGNHTWSHQSSAGSLEKLKMEVTTADIQLNEHGLDNGKIFAYPYGNPSINAQNLLMENKYSIAFTTVNGSMMCAGQKFNLPRIRVGKSNLNFYGL